MDEYGVCDHRLLEVFGCYYLNFKFEEQQK